MNEIKKCSIAGVSFTLERNAYDTLSEYLKSLHATYKDDPDGEEIIADIEARIADIFRERVPSPMMGITYATVLATMQQIGSAEMFGEANRPLNNAEQSNVGQKSTRRFVRSIDDKSIAGVCGGIAEYFGIDATIMRLAFAV